MCDEAKTAWGDCLENCSGNDCDNCQTSNGAECPADNGFGPRITVFRSVMMITRNAKVTAKSTQRAGPNVATTLSVGSTVSSRTPASLSLITTERTIATRAQPTERVSKHVLQTMTSA